MDNIRSYLTHLECTNCQQQFSAQEIHTLCSDCGKVLFARYDLTSVKQIWKKSDLLGRRNDIWRWFEIMPVLSVENVISLGEGATPLLHAHSLGEIHDAKQLYIKDEGLNPTGSFKARGLSAAVSKAKELGISSIAIPSAGNAAAALAAYGSRAKMEIHVFMPNDTPTMMMREAVVYDVNLHLVDGLINQAGQELKASAKNWFDVSTLKEPYRAEGKKTMGLELAEQFNWSLPEAIIYPTGGGTGIVGMWKAFDELEQIGWIGSERPQMISVQSEGCAPIVRAFEKGDSHAELWEDAETIAPGMRVPVAVADYLMLQIIRESNGTALTVSDAEIHSSIHRMASQEGVFAAPEGAATYAAYEKLLASGHLQPEMSVVLFNTGSGMKTPDLITLPKKLDKFKNQGRIF